MQCDIKLEKRASQVENFSACLTNLNYYLTLFPWSDASSNIKPEELNKVLVYSIPTLWDDQDYIQGFDSES